MLRVLFGKGRDLEMLACDVQVERVKTKDDAICGVATLECLRTSMHANGFTSAQCFLSSTLHHPQTIRHATAVANMLKQEVIRAPSHAGSWYSSSKSQLNSQLQGWLDDVKTPIECIGPKSQGETVSQVPAQSARIIIAPYVGFQKTMAYCKYMLRRSPDMQDTLIPGPRQRGLTSHGMLPERR